MPPGFSAHRSDVGPEFPLTAKIENSKEQATRNFENLEENCGRGVDSGELLPRSNRGTGPRGSPQ